MMMKFVKFGFLFVCLLLINNFLFYKFYQSHNPIPIIQTESYLSKNYNSLIDSSVLIDSDMPGGVALGTGIWLQGGYIVTAYHVIDNTTNTKISRLDINTQLNATVYASDPLTDIAILKIVPKDMDKIKDFSPVYLQWAKSDEQTAGENLYILGNPLGIQNTVTEGILSSTDKIFQMINPFVDYIQTDASMNQGNSGGAIVNSNGRIVGISDFMFGGDRSSGLNFGIRSDDAVNSVNQLMKTQKPLQYAYTGLMFSFVNNDVFLIPDPQGPAIKLIQPLDKFVSLNGLKFTSVKQWVAYQKTLKVGQTVIVVVNRNNKDVTIPIVAVAAPNFMDRQQ